MPKEVKPVKCRYERDKQGQCRMVCEDANNNNKEVWKPADDSKCSK